MDQSIVFLADLAHQMGMERSNARKWVIDRGLKLFKLRSPKKNNAMMLALTAEDAETALALRHQEGFNADGTPLNESNLQGVFYIVQVLPILDPTRLKFGFTSNTEQRMLSYRIICPEATILQTWLCKALWERTAIAALSADASEQMGQELFRFLDIDKVIERGHLFFSLLPSV